MLVTKNSYEAKVGGARWYLAVAPVVFFLFTLMGPAGIASAGVNGLCSTCHTMHNSQDGIVVYADGPADTLLKNDCVGCHSNTTAETKLDLGNGTIVPVVYNTVAPTTPLAGGNFYWVVNNGDSYGHNVYGISGEDATLSAAPGSISCANSCHTSLALSVDGNGCQGCHNFLKHHGSEPDPGDPETASSGFYRFLSAPLNSTHLGNGGGPVKGIESSDWEYTGSSTNHNIYYKGTGSDLGDIPESMGKFCAGCHAQFHSPGATTIYADNGDGTSASPWLRHPADFAIPDIGEFANAAGGIVGTDYDPLVPVGKDLTDTVNKDIVVAGDTVMCLSCHRAHGSPYPHMLRWEGDNMRTGAVIGGSQDPAVVGTGCFKCHAAKD